MKIVIKRTKFMLIAALAVYGALVVTLSAFSGGPPTGRTGAPGETTCADCHSPEALTGQLHIIPPGGYVPGQTYTVQVQHVTTDTSRAAWGFELTSLTSSNAVAGTFANTTAFTRTRTGGGRNYIEQNTTGAFLGQTGGASWTFSWTAPSTNVGLITFYAAGLQGNNDGTEDGDQTYTTFAVVPVGGPTPTPTPTPVPSPPVPTSVVSRKTHGASGIFDVPLPLSSPSGIECRSTGGTNDHTIVVTFSSTVTVNGSPQAQVMSGTATVGIGGISNGGMVTIDVNSVIVPLTNVANAQTIQVRLNNVSSGTASGDVTIPMSVLAGDSNANGAVNSGDVAQTKARLGQTLDATNFRSDVNANGAINSGDVAQTKSLLGTGLPSAYESPLPDEETIETPLEMQQP